MQKKFLILALLPFLVGCKNTKEENQFETDKNGRLYSPSWREKENLIVFHSDDPQEDNTTGEDLGCGGADTMDEDVMEGLRQKNMTQEKLISAVKAQLGV